VATEKANETALEEHDTVELDAIEAALARIQAGTYGHCTDCGTAILPARLQAAPATHRCLPCQEKAEHIRAA
jgi:DnaK suppressor protein